MVTNSRNNQTSSANTTHVVNRRVTAADRQKVQTDAATVKSTDNKPTRWVQLRLIPIWVRLIIVGLLIFFAMIIGYQIGYTVIGDGSSNGSFDFSTWRHILDIINGKE